MSPDNVRTYGLFLSFNRKRVGSYLSNSFVKVPFRRYNFLDSRVLIWYNDYILIGVNFFIEDGR